MKTLTIDDVRKQNMLVLEVISGSKAYGLDTPTSDTDIKGVYVLPQDLYYGMGYAPQVSNETNDIVYYELGRFMELLALNNPNIMEMLATPEACILYKHPLMESIQQDMFLSKKCEATFANYAISQIKKAYGLEKKVLNTMEEKRKSVLDFCFVYEDKKAVELMDFLAKRSMDQSKVGLAAVSHLKGCYNFYYDENGSYDGIVKKENANDVSLSSIPKSASPLALLYFNKEGYSVYCKQYKSYWEWVEKRNDERYSTIMEHGKRYDSKNMMHVFRLLLMAKEIAEEGKINVVRKDRDFLLSVKKGAFEYDDLLSKAMAMCEKLSEAYSYSSLPETPDMEKIDQLLIKLRKAYYALSV